MKICEEKIPPLMVFQELFNENVLFARGINWLYPDKTEEQRLMGFANISSELLMTGKTLGEYLTDAVMYSKSPLFAAIVKEPTEARKKALAYDIALIKKIVKEYTASAVKKALADIAGATADYAALPEYESGKFTLNADRLIKFAQKNGTGDFAKYKAFTFRGGKLIPVEHIDPIRLTDLKNYELQRNQVVENTIAFLNGLPAQNALLYGDRGCGKSSTIKAILNEYDQLRMIELPKAEIAGLGDRPLRDRRKQERRGRREHVPCGSFRTVHHVHTAEPRDLFRHRKTACRGYGYRDRRQRAYPGCGALCTQARRTFTAHRTAVRGLAQRAH